MQKLEYFFLVSRLIAQIHATNVIRQFDLSELFRIVYTKTDLDMDDLFNFSLILNGISMTIKEHTIVVRSLQLDEFEFGTK